MQEQQTALAGLYDGNPRRTTPCPTAERLLAAFCSITLYFYPDESREISPLNSLQTQILQLMGMDESLYSLPEWFNSTKPAVFPKMFYSFPVYSGQQEHLEYQILLSE